MFLIAIPAQKFWPINNHIHNKKLKYLKFFL